MPTTKQLIVNATELRPGDKILTGVDLNSYHQVQSVIACDKASIDVRYTDGDSLHSFLTTERMHILRPTTRHSYGLY